MQFYGISFVHPYKQSVRWQDVLDTQTHPQINPFRSYIEPRPTV
jgi:hypothetical protein